MKVHRNEFLNFMQNITGIKTRLNLLTVKIDAK